MSMYEIKNNAETPDALDIFIYSDVDDAWWDDSAMGADKFRKELEKNKNASQINLFINSMGGSVSEGVAIFNQIKRHKANVTAYIDGFACSIASVIPMAADRVVMSENAMLMIHNPWCFSMGNAKELRKTADDLDKVRDGCIMPAYRSKCGDKITDEKLSELLDEETYLTAAEALEYGFCDEILSLSTDDKKADAADKVNQRYDAARKEIRNSMAARFGEMVAKMKAKESAPVQVAMETAEIAAEKQQEETHENVSEPVAEPENKTESEPEKAESTPQPVEDKAEISALFLKILKGEM